MEANKRLLCLWAKPSGYMDACLRDLELLGIKTLCLAQRPPEQTAAPYDLRPYESYQLLDERQLRRDYLPPDVLREVRDFAPTSVLVAGWAFPAYRRLCRQLAATGCQVILGADTPRLNLPKAKALTLRYRPFFRSVDTVLVPGALGRHVMTRLGFSPNKVRAGLFAADGDSFGPPDDSPRDRLSFIYVGRLVPHKGIMTLLTAYSYIHTRYGPECKLTICGDGPLRGQVLRDPRVDYRGFVQPNELPSVLREGHVFVLPSEREPWGVAAAEAAASGLALLTSDEVGSNADLLIEGETGLRFASGDADDLANAMRWFLEHRGRLESIRSAATQRAAPFLSHRWARRVDGILS